MNATTSIADIENELKRLANQQNESNQLRACLFNLIIFCRHSNRAAELRQVVVNVVAKFPCRILFIEEDDKATEIRSHVSSVISGQEDNLVICDEISLHTPPSQLGRVPFILFPLLVPDLPIYLIWGQDPTIEDPILMTMQKYACRLIFDSQRTEELQSFSQRMLKLISSSPIEIMDSQWAQLSSWRDVLSQTFNSFQKVEHLRLANRITISYNSLPEGSKRHPHVKAFFLQAWLAGQLGWRFESVNGNLLLYHNGRESVVVSLEPLEAADHPLGSLISFQASTADGHAYVISPDSDPTKVVVHVFTNDLCKMPFYLNLKDPAKGSAFMREIFYRRCSSHYAHMLTMISQTPAGYDC